MTSRPYQSDAQRAVFAAWEEYRRVLLVVPTGGGKTIIMSKIAEQLAAEGKRILLLAHRFELLDQALKKMHAASGLIGQLEKAGDRASLDAGLVVASIQTMAARGERWDADAFDYIFVDEAHHVLAESYRYVLDLFPAAKVLGVTATPDRGDQKNLGEYFDTVAFEIGLFDLVNQGFLAPITVKALPLSIDLSTVKSSRGDFDANQLSTALDPYLDEIAAAIAEHAVDEFGFQRRTLVFLPLRVTSQKFVSICRRIGISADHVDGESPDRARILERFAAGEFSVLANAMLLTEGFDDPGISCVVPLRATRSQSLYAQMIGRGTRLADGKRDLLLLDFLWHHQRHRLCRPANLIAKTAEEADAINARIEAIARKEAAREERQYTAGAAVPEIVAEQIPMDLQGLASAAQADREEALRKKLEAAAKGKSKTLLSADEFAAAHDRIDLVEFEGRMKWELADTTPAQDAMLKRAGVNPATVRGFQHASKLLDLFRLKQPIQMASPKVKALMRRMHWRSADGQRGPEEATAQDGRQFFQTLNQRKARRKEPSLF